KPATTSCRQIPTLASLVRDDTGGESVIPREASGSTHPSPKPATTSSRHSLRSCGMTERGERVRDDSQDRRGMTGGYQLPVEGTSVPRHHTRSVRARLGVVTVGHLRIGGRAALHLLQDLEE